MELKDYIKKHGTITKAARELGVSRVHLSHIINGRYNPGAALARRIEAWSRGAVLARELLKL